MEVANIKILSAKACKPILRRIAYQIYEANYDVSTLVLLGIGERGFTMASLLAEELRSISTKTILCFQFQELFSKVEIEIKNQVENQNCILVDDVLYTGKTLFQAAAIVVSFKPNCLQIAVLVNRGHRSLPISADFIGLELATTLQEYITVKMDTEINKSFEVFLS